MTQTDRTGVLVIGAGRSGTSTLARALMALGIEFGRQLKAPTRKNPRGFFEEVNLLAISKRVRRAMGLRAEHVRLLTAEDWQRVDLTGLRREMRRAIDAAMGGAPIWGFKYASTSRLLPFWLPLLEEMQVRPAFVLAYRNPLAIAASRRQLDAERGQQEKTDLEWLANLVPYLHLTRGHPLVVVDYDRLVTSPRTELARVARMLGVTPEPGRIATFVDEFLNPDLRHNAYDAGALKTDRTLHPLVRRGALLLDRLARQELQPEDDFWEAWSDLRRALYDSTGRHAEVDRQIDARRRARWWDVATPLKKAWQARPLY